MSFPFFFICYLEIIYNKRFANCSTGCWFTVSLKPFLSGERNSPWRGFLPICINVPVTCVHGGENGTLALLVI